MNPKTEARLAREARARELLKLIHQYYIAVDDLTDQRDIHKANRPDQPTTNSWVNHYNYLSSKLQVLAHEHAAVKKEWDSLPARNRITAIRLLNRVSRWYNPEHQAPYYIEGKYWPPKPV